MKDQSNTIIQYTVCVFALSYAHAPLQLQASINNTFPSPIRPGPPPPLQTFPWPGCLKTQTSRARRPSPPLSPAPSHLEPSRPPVIGSRNQCLHAAKWESISYSNWSGELGGETLFSLPVHLLDLFYFEEHVTSDGLGGAGRNRRGMSGSDWGGGNPFYAKSYPEVTSCFQK